MARRDRWKSHHSYPYRNLLLPQPQNEVFFVAPLTPFYTLTPSHPTKLSLYFWGWEAAICQYPDVYQEKNILGSHPFTYKYLSSTYDVWAWL